MAATANIRRPAMELLSVPITKPEATNFIFGQSHFIKTVEDLHEALVGTVPGIRFGLAFCEASGKRLVRWSGTDESLIDLACENAARSVRGTRSSSSWVTGSSPSMCSAPCVRCRRSAGSTARQQTPLKSSSRRRMAGGPCWASSMAHRRWGIETDADIRERRELLRKFGYKL